MDNTYKCVLRKSNWSVLKNKYKFDSVDFSHIDTYTDIEKHCRCTKS